MRFRSAVSTALAAGLVALGAQHVSAGQFEPRLSYPAKPGEKSVALTFDACAGGFDKRIFDVLMDEDVKATIFVTDRWIRHNGANLKVLESRPDLFQIENHGANHVPPVTDALEVFGIRTAGSVEAVKAEVEGGSRSIKAATGRRPLWYRGATARYSADALKAISDMKFRVAGYSLNADKGASLPAGVVARRIERAKPGDVVIAHINQPHRPAGAGVAAGVRALKKAGWSFVLLGDVEPVEENRRPLIVEPHETADQSPEPRPRPKSAAKEPAAKETSPKDISTKDPATRDPVSAKEPPAAKAPADRKSTAPATDGEDPVEPRAEPAAPDSAEAPGEEEQARPSMQLKPKAGGQWFAPKDTGATPAERKPAPPQPRVNP